MSKNVLQQCPKIFCNFVQKVLAKNKGSHGIGLKRMEDIVNNVEGIFMINSENHVFTVHIMIPQKEAENETNDFNS